MQKALIRKCLDTLLVIMTLVTAGYFAVRLWETPALHPAALHTEPVCTVIVDAGHGGADGGCVSPDGTVEAGLNLAVVRLLEEELTNRGLRVVLTRSDENSLKRDKAADMQERRRILNESHGDLVVSVHMNMFQDRSVHGSMAFFMEGSLDGEKLAQCVIDAVCDSTGQGRRSANPGDYFIIRESPLPSVLVECGFLSNAEEEKRLLDAEYQKLLAVGIAEGIVAYLDGSE